MAQYVLSPIYFRSDPVIGNLGLINTMYYGGGNHTIPSDAAQGAHFYTAGTFAYAGSACGKAGLVRYSYRLGHVALSNTHLECRAGSNADWLFWDDFLNNSMTSVVNPHNPWLVWALFSITGYASLINAWSVNPAKAQKRLNQPDPMRPIWLFLFFLNVGFSMFSESLKPTDLRRSRWQGGIPRASS